MNFFQFAENIKNYPVDKFENDLIKEIESSDSIKELQEMQWDKGQDSDGNVLGLYSKATEILSFGRKKAGTPFDLDDTGDFRKQTKINTIEKGSDLSFFFDSTGKNTNDLLQKIGPRMFGLQNQNQNKMAFEAKEIAVELLKKNLKLK